MGQGNVAGRMNKCGSGVIMYTYPAWTFGGKHKGSGDPPGPGAGKYVLPDGFGTTGPAFGPPPRRAAPPSHGPAAYGPGTKPGTLSSERKGPGYSFGLKTARPNDATPGPQDYNGNWNATAPAHPATGWGVPPVRAASAPRPYRAPEPLPPKPAKGPSFGLARRPLAQDPTPGPLAYQPNCVGSNCCMACDASKGVTFGMRPPMFYGPQARLTATPGPHYHVECSTIGAATQNCETGSSTFRRSRARQ